MLGNFGQIKPMEDGYKEPAELKFERIAIAIIEQQKSDEQNSYCVFKNFLEKLKSDDRFDKSDLNKKPPQFFDIQSSYVSKESANALLHIQSKYVKKEIRKNNNETTTIIPPRMVVDMSEYDEAVIDSYLKSNNEDHENQMVKKAHAYAHQLTDMSKYDQHVVDAFLASHPDYQERLSRIAKSVYKSAFFHGVVATGATAGLGYGAWLCFNRNK